jgi:hypothetical protein
MESNAIPRRGTFDGPQRQRELPLSHRQVPHQRLRRQNRPGTPSPLSPFLSLSLFPLFNDFARTSLFPLFMTPPPIPP